VIENVLRRWTRISASFRSTLRTFPRERRQALINLKAVGLLQYAYKRADELSGASSSASLSPARDAAAGAHSADEPVSSLDPKLSRVVLDILKRVCREDGITALVTCTRSS